MSFKFIDPRELILYDVSTRTTKPSITAFIKKHVSNAHWKIRRGTPYRKNGEECQRVFITFNQPENVDEFMKQQTFQLDGKPLKVTRTLAKPCSVSDRFGTGLRIKIQTSDNNHTRVPKLKENDLKKYFQQFGEIIKYEWKNTDQTEALFTFPHYDFVDRIILHNPLPEIKGVKLELEKIRTAEDHITYEHNYDIHVTNLPNGVTSEQLSTIFKVPIALILLYPCYRLEQSRVVGERSSSEAWITNFTDEKVAQSLAQEKTGTFVDTNRICCEVAPASIKEEELCESFNKGQCKFSVDTCYYKHFTCSKPDTCDDEYCWFGHSDKRTTRSINKPEYRSEDAPYRIKISNLPPNVTHESLMTRLKIPSKLSNHLILQPAEQNPDSPRMAYFIRQLLENRVRNQIDKWHNTSFSLVLPQKIQCQLEFNQDYFEWNDFKDMPQIFHNSRCSSPQLSIQSTHSNQIKSIPWYSSAASTISCKPRVSKKLSIIEQSNGTSSSPINQLVTPKKKHTINSLRAQSVFRSRQPPSDMLSLSTHWQWSNQMIPNDKFQSDELYWIESQSIKQKNVVIKIYLPQNHQCTRLRAYREQIALKRLTKLTCIPKLLHTNINVASDDQTNKELWNIMRLIDAETLFDYIKYTKLDIREALKITQQLLTLVKQIHAENVIHRDIQPKNILVKHRSNNDEISLTLMNFSSAWIIDDQWTNSVENIHDELGNAFYRMPQFEQRQNEDNEQLRQYRHSPKNDATGIGAILFWLITGHEPMESQDISGQAPHKLQNNSKIIEKKMNEITAFRTDLKIREHLKRHLTLVFDRAFSGPNLQWSVDELDYQLQFMSALIVNENEQVNYFPVVQNTNNTVFSPSIPCEDPFVYVVSLIHHLKHQFVMRYSKCLHWSSEKKTSWSIQDKRIENYDFLIFSYQEKECSVDIKWDVHILKEQKLLVNVKAKTNNKIIIELPLGLWEIKQQTMDFDVHLKNFEMAIKILINILLKTIVE